MDELPGCFPYTRGIQPTMYRGRLWTMRQYAGFGSAAESNTRYHYLLAQGVSGLSVAFDLPTQMGYDSDHPLAQGEVGRVGVAIDTLDDMQRLLEGLPLDRVSTSMTINATAAILLALYVAVARSRGLSPDRLSGTVQNDVLKEYIARGTYIYPPASSLRIIGDLFAYCRSELPRWNAISVSGYPLREGGDDRPEDAADPRPRERRRRHRRSARRSVRRRVADQRSRGAGRRLPPRDRRLGRDGAGARERLPAARDPGGGVPPPAGGRARREGDRRHESLRRGGSSGRRHADPDPEDRPAAGGGAARPAGGV